jgi:hypothetical protein
MNPFIFASGFIELTSTWPYLRDQIREKTKPAIVSWGTWFILSSLTALASYSAGAIAAAILSVAIAIECLLVVLISIGKWNFQYSFFDFLCQLGALVGVVAWYLSNDPVIALVIFVISDAIGAIPTLRHAWKYPHEETVYTYSLSMAGNSFAAASAINFSFTELLVPLYLLALNATLSTVIIQRTQYFTRIGEQRTGIRCVYRR